MAFETIEFVPGIGRRVWARHDTFEAAVAAIKRRANLVLFELDQDHPHCADAFLSTGVVLSIEENAAS
jgi:hypothetical protein